MQNESEPTPKAPQRITMSTIASMLGVTKTTVSLALRDHPSISDKTAKRVKDLAQKLNYRPDPAISAIATQRWIGTSPECHRVIAFLSHHRPAVKTPAESYFNPAKERAAELGYKLEPFYLDDYPNAQAVSRVLYTRGIRGILVPPIQNPNSKRAMHLDWRKFTAVCCGIGRVQPPVHTVSADTFTHTRLAWHILAQAGYRRVGAALHCHSPLAHDDWLRIGATTAAMRFHNLEESAAIPIHTGEIMDRDALLSWYETYKPEVILGFNHAVGEILEDSGIKLPDDVEFICLSTPPGCKWSGISHHFDEIARKSVDLLDHELRYNRWGLPKSPNITLVQPKWNPGNTLRAVPEFIEDRLVSIAAQPEHAEPALA